MSREGHRVGQPMRATVQHRRNGGGTIHTQTRPQETPPAKTDSEDKRRKRVLTVQQTGDTLAQRLD